MFKKGDEVLIQERNFTAGIILKIDIVEKMVVVKYTVNGEQMCDWFYFHKIIKSLSNNENLELKLAQLSALADIALDNKDKDWLFSISIEMQNVKKQLAKLKATNS